MKNLVLWLVPLILVGFVTGLKHPICGQEPGVVGLCRASIISFTYNPVLNSCSMFQYGGCDGNENRFPTSQLCKDKCVK